MCRQGQNSSRHRTTTPVSDMLGRRQPNDDYHRHAFSASGRSTERNSRTSDCAFGRTHRRLQRQCAILRRCSRPKSEAANGERAADGAAKQSLSCTQLVSIGHASVRKPKKPACTGDVDAITRKAPLGLPHRPQSYSTREAGKGSSWHFLSDGFQTRGQYLIPYGFFLKSLDHAMDAVAIATTVIRSPFRRTRSQIAMLNTSSVKG